jgi:hypothetical protein
MPEEPQPATITIERPRAMIVMKFPYQCDTVDSFRVLKAHVFSFTHLAWLKAF